MTILIADDEYIIRHWLRNLFESAGINVICASDGNEALAVMQGSQIDLMILDYAMPGLNGIELLKQNHKQIPCIMISGTESIEVIKSAFENGVEFYLRKEDISSKDLIGLVKTVNIMSRFK